MGGFSVVRPDLRFTALNVTAVLYAVCGAETTIFVLQSAIFALR